jgi:hypothetical protein
LGFLRSRAHGYKAAFRVERYRAAAESLRQTDPDMYASILARAEGEAAESARKDPDAYVAIFLSIAEEEGVIGSPETALSDSEELESVQMTDVKETARAAIRAFFQAEDWAVDELEDGGFLGTTRGDNGSFKLWIPGSYDGNLTVYSVLNDPIPMAKLDAVSELVTRVNFMISFGNFELDLSDGELRFRSNVFFKNNLDSLTTPFIADLVYMNAIQCDTYYPAIMGVVHAGRTPEEALAAVQ